MSLLPRYRVNAPNVIAEVVDGEAIIVNLDSGAYYSLQGCGAEAWELVAQGASLDEMTAAFGQRYDAHPDVIAQALRALLGQLAREQLIVAAEHPEQLAPPRAPAAPRLPFQPPALQKYTDMADLLLLDPIHDVDSTGWPNPAPGPRQPDQDIRHERQ